MARPRKDGLDYFPHDTDAASDEKLEALTILYGNDGYAFYFIMLERIYRTANQELDVSDAETIQILSRKVSVTTQKFEQILQTALNRGCFDKQLYQEKGVLTSNGIKKRAEVVIKKREEMRDRYQKGVSDAETREETPPETPQSKAKHSIEENSKESIITFDENSLEYYLALKLRAGIISNDLKARVPEPTVKDMQKWCKVFDAMLRLDERTQEEIEQVITFATTDSFWMTNILSAKKLREKFGALYLKAKNTRSGKSNNAMLDFLANEGGTGLL